MATYHPHVFSVFFVRLVLNAITAIVNKGLGGKISNNMNN